MQNGDDEQVQAIKRRQEETQKVHKLLAGKTFLLGRETPVYLL